MNNLYWLPILIAIAFLLARVAGGHSLKLGITPRQATFALLGLTIVALAGAAVSLFLQ